jgi:subtilisin family serine protease
MLLSLLSACAMETPHATGTLDPSPAAATAGTLVVDLVDGTSLADARKATGLDLRWVAPQTEDEALAEVEVPDLAEAQRAVESLPIVEVAEPSIEVEAYGFPNDPMYDAQWNFEIVGAKQGWRMGGGRGVTVAVVDTGVTEGRGPRGHDDPSRRQLHRRLARRRRRQRSRHARRGHDRADDEQCARGRRASRRTRRSFR